MTENKSAQPQDWLKIAKLAGEHGIRYQTNARLEAFLAALSTPQPESVEAAIEAGARAIAEGEGCDFDAKCLHEIEGDGGELPKDWDGCCTLDRCVGKHFEDHDAENARDFYRKCARAVVAAMPAATRNDGLQVALAEAIEALSSLEAACDNLAYTRSSKTYNSMIHDDGAHDQLITLDAARRIAAQVVAKHGVGR